MPPWGMNWLSPRETLPQTPEWAIYVSLSSRESSSLSQMSRSDTTNATGWAKSEQQDWGFQISILRKVQALPLFWKQRLCLQFAPISYSPVDSWQCNGLNMTFIRCGQEFLLDNLHLSLVFTLGPQKLELENVSGWRWFPICIVIPEVVTALSMRYLSE